MAEYEADPGVRDERYGGRSLVAIFGDRSAAAEAARQLRDEAFNDIWIGVTHVAQDGSAPDTMRPAAVAGSPSSPIPPSGSVPSAPPTGRGGDLVVESDAQTFVEKLGRFFSGEAGTRSLYEELQRHGVDPAAARRIDEQIPPESAVLTVDGSNHPEAAAAIIEDCGGHIVAGEAFDGADTFDAGAPSDAGASADARTERRGSEVLGYRDPQRYARGTEIDDQRRVQLRGERLDVDKRSEAAGAATVAKDVVERRREMDVPVVREELFVERRAPSEVTGDAGEIGSDRETISIPLMRERVVVTKRPVVVGEYTVGKRSVTENQHVSETTREEKLRVNDTSNEAATEPGSTSTATATRDVPPDASRN